MTAGGEVSRLPDARTDAEKHVDTGAPHACAACPICAERLRRVEIVAAAGGDEPAAVLAALHRIDARIARIERTLGTVIDVALELAPFPFRARLRRILDHARGDDAAAERRQA